MIVTVKFELDETWKDYRNCNPEIIADDMDLIHKDGIRIINLDIEND